MNSTATQTGTWNNWKGHGRPQRFVYLGQDRKHAGQDGRLVTSVATGNTSWYRYLDDNGKCVFQGGVATKFWASPAPAEVKVPEQRQPLAAGDPAVSTTQPAKATRPSRNAKLAPCHCGCGAQVKGLYKQGHDARHAAAVALKVQRSLMIDPGQETNSLMRELPTEALRIKAAKIVANRIK